MKLTAFRITNSAHGAQVTLRAMPGAPLTRTQVARARRALCPDNACALRHGALREHGPQACLIRLLPTGESTISPKEDSNA